MAWYLNRYECVECNVAWEDEWSCCCDDECPECKVDHTPFDSDDLSAYIEQPDPGTYQIYYSLPESSDTPDYSFFAEVKIKNLALALEQLAREMAKPT